MRRAMTTCLRAVAFLAPVAALILASSVIGTTLAETMTASARPGIRPPEHHLPIARHPDSESGPGRGFPEPAHVRVERPGAGSGKAGRTPVSGHGINARPRPERSARWVAAEGIALWNRRYGGARVVALMTRLPALAEEPIRPWLPGDSRC